MKLPFIYIVLRLSCFQYEDCWARPVVVKTNERLQSMMNAAMFYHSLTALSWWIKLSEICPKIMFYFIKIGNIQKKEYSYASGFCLKFWTFFYILSKLFLSDVKLRNFNICWNFLWKVRQQTCHSFVLRPTILLTATDTFAKEGVSIFLPRFGLCELINFGQIGACILLFCLLGLLIATMVASLIAFHCFVISCIQIYHSTAFLKSLSCIRFLEFNVSAKYYIINMSKMSILFHYLFCAINRIVCYETFQTKAFFRGMAFPLYSEGFRSSLFFGLYGKLLGTERSAREHSCLSIAIAAGIAGGIQGVAATPIELVKVNLQSPNG